MSSAMTGMAGLVCNACNQGPVACCCPQAPVPEAVENPPGLSRLSYRVGDYSRFFEAMKRRISQWELPDSDRRPLKDLSTRSTEDPAIAWIDAWAVSADVLSFYQERIVNEGFLRTATERLSVRELARQIGYQLKPGVAASAYLAWTVETAPTAPIESYIPAGTQVQSLPLAAGQLPQTFETETEFTAHREWNELHIRSSSPQVLKVNSALVELTGISLQLQRGDMLVLRSGSSASAYPIKSIRENSAKGTTKVLLDNPGGSSIEQIPEWANYTGASQVSDGEAILPMNLEMVTSKIFYKTWDEADLQQFLDYHGWNKTQCLAMLREVINQKSSAQVLRLKESLGFYGSNAPRYLSLPSDIRASTSAYPYNWDSSWTIWKDSLENTDYQRCHVYIEREMKELRPGQTVVAERKDGTRKVWTLSKTVTESMNGFALPSKVTGLSIQGLGSGDKKTSFELKTTRLHVGEHFLNLSQVALDKRIEAQTDTVVLSVMVLGLTEGQAVSLIGSLAEARDQIISEVLILKKIEHCAGFTRLQFEEGIKETYLRETVILNGNVTLATHGETVRNEILGTSDGATQNQRYYLKKTPLTYIPSSDVSGSTAEMEVRVNGVLWHPTKSLYFSGNRNRDYQIKHTEDGAVMLQFGDGINGTVPPAASDGVKASYRSGIGLVGQVDAESITLMKQKPHGAKGLRNPLPAWGGENSESMEDARENAPRTVRTLDRVVSLLDYEDFARGYAGIGKASASLLWVGRQQIIHLSVLSVTGEPVAETNLALFVKALNQVRDPYIAFQVQNGLHDQFRIKLGILIHPDYLFEEVEKNVRSLLLERYSFSELSFGDSVYASQIIEVVSTVTGVVAVDIDDLSVIGESPSNEGIRAWIPARLASVSEGSVTAEPARTLSLGSVSLEITQRQNL